MSLKGISTIFIALFFITIFQLSDSFSQPQTITNPGQATPYYTIINSLNLIKGKKYDQWVSKWCSKSQLCYNTNATRSVKRYNLPKIQRIAGNCLKGSNNTINVTRVDGNPARDTNIKVFINCAPSMAQLFWLVKEDGWKVKKL